MLPFFRHLRAARLFLRCQPYVELPADAAGTFWSPADAAAWLAFRQTPAGRKLGLLLTNQITRAAVAATANTDPAQATHQCGYASGIRGTVTILDSLLPAQIIPGSGSSTGFDDPAISPGTRVSAPAPFPEADRNALAHLRP